ncbi:ABC transporter ATP-binding protein [Candidatus Methylopumilus universalis]|jgi:ABC-2 type transport system ATP-binding protein|uniref:ABC transporter ATP-binding protein n=1 Tax=Candidatus Methylopumilus universalis TaxID=2588536 RepID=A0AAX1EYQ3_9PROT|nr:ABC transporter ATP-binding protein [Candidatus Methylopumilus universalis]QDC40634.1 ABC transporter ATP-binding protein [Candidatus Methylopumilus universalis]QDC41923.1 ABC transporter ATP-binding protein [Candidatus Methylopumilus universalis]QDC54310.1 ABC transporter ATP-binding protein [Candidatus Methylopumilus universalis]QDC55592.1 ABC transporter ATP-binding protein [Candidatus Methylopumilus universalis]QDC56873.1 ABC transporter ATP-binding protein [Candidatus Methylopumilus un
MKKAIVFNKVRKSFGKLEALKGIDLTIEEGEFFALLGPNGAGKSTLINILAGLAKPSSGSIKVMGYDVIQDYQNARRSLGVVPQELVFDPFFNVREMLRFQAGYFGKGRENDDWIDEVIEGLDLQEKANTNMRMLSGGMKRRALIAQALVHKPPVIVLDEPTAGVDVELRNRLWQFIKKLNQKGHTIVLTTHYLEEAEALCSRVAMMDQGKVVALDKTRNLLKRFSAKNLKLRLDLKGKKIPINIQKLIQSKDHDFITFLLEEISEVEFIMGELKKTKIKILDMELTNSDLENVFLKLTGSKR